MERAVQSAAEVLSLGAPAKDESGLFSIESVRSAKGKTVFERTTLQQPTSTNTTPAGYYHRFKESNA
jgi:hypothetical protein